MSHDPHRTMWAAVINESLRVTGLYQDWLAGKSKSKPHNITESEAAQEWRFLTDKHGEWAASRRDVCAAVGIDSCFLRERVLAAKERGELRSMHTFDFADASSAAVKMEIENGK